MKRVISVFMALVLSLGILSPAVYALEEPSGEIKQLAIKTIVTYGTENEELEIFRYIIPGKRFLLHGYYTRFEVVMTRNNEVKRYETKTWWSTYDAMTLEKAAQKDEKLGTILPAVQEAVTDIYLREAYDDLIANPDAAAFLSQQWVDTASGWLAEQVWDDIDGFCLDIVGVGMSNRKLLSKLYEIGREVYSAYDNSQSNNSIQESIMDNELLRNFLWSIQFFLDFTEYAMYKAMGVVVDVPNPFVEKFEQDIVALHDAARLIVE